MTDKKILIRSIIIDIAVILILIGLALFTFLAARNILLGTALTLIASIVVFMLVLDLKMYSNKNKAPIKTSSRRKRCCICGCQLTGTGHNPDGAIWRNAAGELESANFEPNDRCCDKCNENYVIPGRLYRINRENRKEKL